MDSFEHKRGMVKMLLDMLKKNAADEVGNGLKHPEGEGDMHGIQAENVENIDHKMDEPTPEHDVVTTHDLHEGGMVMDRVSEGGYPAAPEKKIPYESTSGDGQPDKEGAAKEEASESQEERQAEGDTTPSMFESFLRRKKK
jgi:hypothetical protein